MAEGNPRQRQQRMTRADIEQYVARRVQEPGLHEVDPKTWADIIDATEAQLPADRPWRTRHHSRRWASRQLTELLSGWAS